LSAEKLLERVTSFIDETLPPECRRHTETFNQKVFDEWVGQAFEIKDLIKTIINGRLVPAGQAVELARSWDNLLGYRCNGILSPSIPYGVYAGEMQPLDAPHKPGYNYKRRKFHNENVEPDAPHEGYWREGLGLRYEEGLEDCIENLKAGELAWRSYSYRSLADTVGLVAEDAYPVRS
jgi:hypothetical protein